MAISGAAKKKTKLRLFRTPGSLKLKLVPLSSSPPPPSDHQFTPAASRPRIVFKFRIPPPPQEKEKEKQLSSPQPAMKKKKKRSAADLCEEKHGKRQRRLDSGCCDSTEEILDYVEGRPVYGATANGKVPSVVSRTDLGSIPNRWISGLFALPATAYMLQEQAVHAAEFERTFIAIKPDEVQRGLTIVAQEYHLKHFQIVTGSFVGIKLAVLSKEFAGKH